MYKSEIDTVREALSQINPIVLEYDEWLAVGMIIKDAGGNFQEWDNWSKKDPKRYKESEMLNKWRSFKRSGTNTVGVGTIVKLCKDQGGEIEYTPKENSAGMAFDWNDAIKDPEKIVDFNWLEEIPLPENKEWDGKNDFIQYLKVVFDTEDKVGYVIDSYQTEDGKNLPKRGVWDRTAGRLIQEATKASDLGAVVGDWREDVGAWIRFNPLDGEGCSDTNVIAFRHALVESDEISVEKQYAIYKELELPISALVHSGGRSLHAIVKIDATDYKEYQKRVDFLYRICKKNGLVIDQKNRNPSRLSRMPGVTRNGQKQKLVNVNIGKSSWDEWEDWIAALDDNLPEIENAYNYIKNPPDLADELIKGVLRKGHKMLVSGPSKAGKSFLMLQLVIAIAEGHKWLNWQCAKGKALYVNLELDRASCYHRIKEVYKALKIEPENAKNIDVWNLRGKAMPMTELAPRLIRRATKEDYIAIIIDPIYKVITGDENSADQMAEFCNQFDKVCSELQAATIYCHHHSKGEQGQKRASDRASGSGVFARDPDALIDMIELEISEDLRNTHVNRKEFAALSEALSLDNPNWKDDVDDIGTSTTQLVKWMNKENLNHVVQAIRPEARRKAMTETGWRIEGILREFASFEPKEIWFSYPTHYIDDSGLLTDAKAKGEQLAKRTRQEATEDKKAETRQRYEAAFLSLESFSGGAPVMLEDLANSLGITERAVTNWINRNEKDTRLKHLKGVVFIDKKSDSTH